MRAGKLPSHQGLSVVQSDSRASKKNGDRQAEQKRRRDDLGERFGARPGNESLGLADLWGDSVADGEVAGN